MARPGGVDGIALGTILAGSVFVYAGFKGYSIPQAVQAVVQGKSPAGLTQAYPITGMSTVPSGGGSPLADDMLKYVGKVPYKWGGANPSGWDCSGAVNYCAGHDLGLPIPFYKPGTFTGAAHGPPTLAWLAWAPAHLQHVPAGNVIQGDLVIWQTHMGVAINGTQYVSAYDSAEGTVVHDIHGGGPVGEVATFWRYAGSVTSIITGSGVSP